jgi:hypothetical protein
MNLFTIIGVVVVVLLVAGYFGIKAPPVVSGGYQGLNSAALG